MAAMSCDRRLGRVVSVYDGDTFDVAMYVPGTEMPFAWRVRLAGIDTPELRTRNAHEKQQATECRDVLANLLPTGTVVVIDFEKKLDKYGRVLARVYVNKRTDKSCDTTISAKIDVSTYMLENTCARPYTGEKKQPW